MSREDEINWYHGKISRDKAEQILLEDDGEDGQFLVRESNSSVGDFVLSVLHDRQVVHYQIRKHGEDAFYSVDETKTCHGLESLIEYYQEDANGLVTKLTKLCKCGPPPHDSRRNGKTNLLHRATKEGNYTIVSELVKSGRELEAKNDQGQTAVHLSSLMGQDDILKKLIDNEAIVNCRDTKGNTPLHYACQNNYPSTVLLLVREGNANIQARNTDTGWVPLHNAASRGHIEVVKVLLSLNAPVNPRTLKNELPWQLAMANDHTDCVDVLKNYRSPVPKTRKEQWYHGTLSRTEAYSLISKSGYRDGSYLVRLSDRNNGCYVLTMLHEQQLFHFIIKNEGEYLFIDNGPYLESLEHVIDYYSSIADGLPCILQYNVPPAPKPPLPKFEPKLFNVCKDDNMYINESELQLGPVIGEGEFGSVIKGSYKEQSVAIKTLHKEHSETNKESFLFEANVMTKLNHHCIVKLIGVCLKPTLRMVQELVAFGSMLTYLLDHPENVSPDYELKLWAAQIACGMQYLEEKKFVHRDLAARNILLASRHQAKISDFGLSRALAVDREYYKAVHGGKWPLRWYAPESFNYGTFSHASDVWSYGVTLWEMFSYGEQPYGERKGTEVIEAIDRGERLEKPPRCPDHVYSIMENCWAYKPKERPTFTQLLHTFSTDTEYMNIQELVKERNLN